MKTMFVRALSLAAATLFIAESGVASAETWHVRRNNGNKACSVQVVQEPGQSLMGRFLSEHESRREASANALTRFATDAGNAEQCPLYTGGTRDECRKEGVELP
jgi:hypothetical protein